MAIIETLTLGFGAGIAKGVLKIWLQDQAIALNVSSSIVDLIKTKTKDKLAQRKANRQFEEIGEKVAKQLLQLFEAEGVDPEDEGLASASHAAGDTLNKTPITSELLVENNLDPSTLAAHFHASAPNATKYFNQLETAFYDRVISEACQYIIDIASQLPSFTERTFAQVLLRENLILEKTDLILEEVQRLRGDRKIDAAEQDAAKFETEYRRAVIRRLDQLELFGADLSSASQRYRLSVAYVALAVEQKVVSEDDLGLRDNVSFENAAKFDTGDELQEDEDQKEVISVDQAISKSNRLFVRGPAGSGKTTLLQWVAVRAASKKFEDPLADWNEKIPFYIRLRDCAAKGLPAPEQFPQLVAPTIAGTMPDQWVHKQLDIGRAVVLVDGLDEVTQQRRGDVHKWLEDLISVFPNPNYILTARPYAAEEDWLFKEGFVETELQEMELADIHAFVEHWHEAVRQELQNEDLKVELSEFQENIKEVLIEDRSIRNLATNPLLCAMLCALHRDRKQQLPSDRIELYRACCEMLIQRRDIERRIRIQDYPEIGYRQKRLLLDDFAYWLIKNGWSQVTEKQADDRFDLKLKNMEGIPEATDGSNIRQLFLHRTGILRQPIQGAIDFAHRTFQEFMAAQAALDEGDIGVLIKNAHDDQWREVIILSAGLARKNESELIVKSLIERGDHEPKNRQQLHLLAVGCLETSIELRHEIKKHVQERLEALVPPKSIAEAKTLAASGELVLPYLTRNPANKSKITIACMRTLALVCTEKSTSILSEYVNDSRLGVQKEILRLPQWLGHQLSHTVFSNVHLSKWDLWHTSSLDSFQYMSSLSQLNLTWMRYIRDLSPLTEMTKLTSLSLVGSKVGNSALADITPLEKMTKLTSLELAGHSRVSDLRPLRLLINLSSLTLNGLDLVSDLKPLEKLPNLSSLTLLDLPQVSDLGPLAKLENLQTLRLSPPLRKKVPPDLAGLID